MAPTTPTLDGDFVVTWRSYGQDWTATDGVVARQYSSLAAAVTPEYIVNQTTLSHESFPAVAMDTDGDIWEVWDGFQTDSAVGHAIYGRWLPAWANTSTTDVMPVRVAVDRALTPGEKVDVKLTLHNPSFTASGAFNVQFFLSPDATITTSDISLGSAVSVATLTPGQTRSTNFTVTLPAGLALASGCLGVIVDPTNALTEVDEFNNTASQAVELHYPRHTSGAETRVNTITTSSQALPGAAMDDANRSVVTWSGNGPGDASGVFFQRYNALGVAHGSETRINTNTTNTQSDAALAINKSTGDFVVTWTSDQTGDNDIYFQRFDASGVAQGAETRVNSTTTGDQRDSQVAMDDSGNFAVVWNAGSPNHVYGQRFNSSSVAQGSEFQVDVASYPGASSSDQTTPSISMDSVGKFVVAWRSGSEENLASDWGIYYQRYDASGNRVGTQVHANLYTTSSQGLPAVALGDAGTVVVAWQSTGQEQYGTSDTANYGIYFQRFDANNIVKSADFVSAFTSNDVRANSYVTSDQWLPAVAIGSDGRFTIAWDSSGQDGSSRGIYFRKYRADGTPDGGMRRANTYTSGDQWVPTVALGSGDATVLAWVSTSQDGSLDGVYAQRYGLEGAAVPFADSFEAGQLSSATWETYSTAQGRIQVVSSDGPYRGTYQLAMDDPIDDGTYSLNEAVLHLNLAGTSLLWRGQTRHGATGLNIPTGRFRSARLAAARTWRNR